MGLSGGLAGVLIQSQVLFTVIFAAIKFRDRPNNGQLAGLGLALTGLVVIGVFRSGATPLAGFILAVAAAAFWAAGNIFTRTAGELKPAALVIWSAALATPLLALDAYITDGKQMWISVTEISTGGLIAALYTAVVSTHICYSLWALLKSKNPPHLVVPYALLVPPVALLFGWLVEGVTASTPELIGSALLTSGVAANFMKIRFASRVRALA